MTMTKEDYMRLPKERLAELLVEVGEKVQFVPSYLDYPRVGTMLCFNGGICTNPLHDCVNCLRSNTGGTFITTNECKK